MPIRQKDPTCGLFFKRGLFKDISESRTVVQGLVLQLFLLQKRSFCVFNQYPQMPKWGVLGGGTHDKLEMPICGWICSLWEGCLWLWLSRKEKIFIESFSGQPAVAKILDCHLNLVVCTHTVKDSPTVQISNTLIFKKKEVWGK